MHFVLIDDLWSEDVVGPQKYPHCFQCFTKDRTYFMHADSEAELQAWKEAIGCFTY